MLLAADTSTMDIGDMIEESDGVDQEEEKTIKLEDTLLYQLIDRGTKQSLAEACRLVTSLSREDVQLRSLDDRRYASSTVI